jgi:hypothetical protein
MLATPPNWGSWLSSANPCTPRGLPTRKWALGCRRERRGSNSISRFHRTRFLRRRLRPSIQPFASRAKKRRRRILHIVSKWVAIIVRRLELTSSNDQDIEVEIVRIRSISACPVAVLSKICLQNALWLWFLTDGTHVCCGISQVYIEVVI